MTSPLGPCPSCGTKEVPERYGSWAQVACVAQDCGLVISTDHWNLLRRKMTAEEARTVLGAVIDAALANDGMGNEFEVAWKSGIAALTGEKT